MASNNIERKINPSDLGIKNPSNSLTEADGSYVDLLAVKPTIIFVRRQGLFGFTYGSWITSFLSTLKNKSLSCYEPRCVDTITLLGIH